MPPNLCRISLLCVLVYSCGPRACVVCHEPLTRYARLRFAHAPGMSGTFSSATNFKGNHYFSDPGMHHVTCVTHVPWCMSESLTRGGGENVPGIPGACATRYFTYLVTERPIQFIRLTITFCGRDNLKYSLPIHCVVKLNQQVNTCTLYFQMLSVNTELSECREISSAILNDVVWGSMSLIITILYN